MGGVVLRAHQRAVSCQSSLKPTIVDQRYAVTSTRRAFPPCTGPSKYLLIPSTVNAGAADPAWSAQYVDPLAVKGLVQSVKNVPVCRWRPFSGGRSRYR